MKSKILLSGAMAAALMAAGCGNDGGSAAPTVIPPPVTSNVMALDTAQVLALAQVTSETSSPPFAVDGGAFTFVDTSETTAPIGVIH